MQRGWIAERYNMKEKALYRTTAVRKPSGYFHRTERDKYILG